jgi:hypothetical protein
MVPLWLCLAGLMWQPVFSAHELVDAAAEVQPGSPGESGGRNPSIIGIERVENLNLLSEGLVASAGSGSAPAHEFRIEARMYRELLRQVMLDSRDRPTSEQLPQPLLLDMVRMSALLHSAADCKTGRVIVCPADLMQQLRTQQSRVTQGLEMLRMMEP